MKYNIPKYQNPAQPLRYQLTEGQYNPQWKKQIEARAEANKPVNTTSEFIFDPKTMRNIPNSNSKMGLKMVSPEFQLMTAGVGSLANKATTILGKIGQAALHGGAQGAIANVSNLSGSEQNLSGMAQDVVGGAVIGGLLKSVGLGVKPTGKYILNKAEPYLMGEKSMPMSWYKPKMNMTNEQWSKFQTNAPKDVNGNFLKGKERLDALLARAKQLEAEKIAKNKNTKIIPEHINIEDNLTRLRGKHSKLDLEIQQWNNNLDPLFNSQKLPESKKQGGKLKRPLLKKK